MTPTLTYIADFSVEVGAPIAVGDTGRGLRRVVPILGGTVGGPRLRGTILPGGADIQIVQADGYTRLEARYVIRLVDDTPVYVVNSGIRSGPPEVMARITRGESVDPDLVYFRTVPRFETAASSYQWLTRPLFVASGVRHPNLVEIKVFEVG
jgi:hypothetical protein